MFKIRCFTVSFERLVWPEAITFSLIIYFFVFLGLTYNIGGQPTLNAILEILSLS
jgi:hypothetical protein